LTHLCRIYSIPTHDKHCCYSL